MRYQIFLDLSPRELERYYRGSASSVAVRDRLGRSLRFPAASLRPFMTHDGIRGWFELETDANHRLKTFRPLGEDSYHGA